jgi:hypothetical protein
MAASSMRPAPRTRRRRPTARYACLHRFVDRIECMGGWVDAWIGRLVG